MNPNELNDFKLSKERGIIEDLYSDQAGRADSIESHIAYLQEKRRIKSKMELFNMLTEEDKEEIEREWNTSMDTLKKKAEEYDAQQASNDVRPEDMRKKQDNKMLNSIKMEDVQKMYESGIQKMTKEFQTDDPYAL